MEADLERLLGVMTHRSLHDVPTTAGTFCNSKKTIETSIYILRAHQAI